MIKERLGVETSLSTGKVGQFDVLVDGKRVVARGGNFITRQFGAGYPDLEDAVDAVRANMAAVPEK